MSSGGAAARTLAGRRVHPVGFGCAPISIRQHPDDEAGLATLVAAVDAGLTHFDTADIYHPPGRGAGHSERLLRRVVGRSAARGELLVATKGGKRWLPDGEVAVDGDPAYLRAACTASLARLGVEQVALYYLHAPDPKVPLVESVEALDALRREGLIASIGLSNVSAEEFEVARAAAPIASVQNRFGVLDRDDLPLVRRCAELGVAYVAWGPFTGLHGSDVRPEAARVHRVAGRLGVSAQRVALAWLLSVSPNVLPIPGSTRPSSVADNAAARTLELSEDDLAELRGG